MIYQISELNAYDLHLVYDTVGYYESGLRRLALSEKKRNEKNNPP